MERKKGLERRVRAGLKKVQLKQKGLLTLSGILPWVETHSV